MEGSQLLRSATTADRIDSMFDKVGLPQNRWGRRRMARYMKGHTPGPMHRQLKTSRNRCQFQIVYPNGHSMICNELLPTYRDECPWHQAEVVVDEGSMFRLGKQNAAKRAIETADV